MASRIFGPVALQTGRYAPKFVGSGLNLSRPPSLYGERGRDTGAMSKTPAPARTPARPPNRVRIIWVVGRGCGPVPPANEGEQRI